MIAVKLFNPDTMLSGLYEVKQDEYIEIVCKEKGFDLKTFYDSNSIILNNLLKNL